MADFKASLFKLVAAAVLEAYVVHMVRDWINLRRSMRILTRFCAGCEELAPHDGVEDSGGA